MKAFNFIICLAVSTAALVACGKKDSKDAVDIRKNNIRDNGANSTAYNSPGASQNGIVLNGVVYAPAIYQTDFNDLVHDFMSASIAPEYVGNVSAQLDDGTGMYFGGDVRLQNGVLQPGSTSGSISSTSSIAIQVFDSYVDQGLGSLSSTHLSNAQGTVNGSQAQITFSDSFGSVTLSGQIDSQWFTGTFSYNNVRRYDGSPGRGGDIGKFQVHTCQFFHCN